MKQLYYVIRTLLRGRGSNIIKVISLGLGLTMSILLFSRVAFEQSYDTCYKDYDDLYQIYSIFSAEGEQFEPQKQNWSCGRCHFGEFSQRGRGGCQHCVFCFFTTLQWQCTHRCPENISRFTFFQDYGY